MIILNAMLLNLSILLLSMSSLYECKTIHSNFTEEFINLAVNPDYIYIGGKNSLIQLSSSLKVVNIKPIEGRNWLLIPYKTGNKGSILISCDYKGEYQSTCTGYRSNLSRVNGYTTKDINIKNPQARYTTTTIGSKNILTIASSECIKASTASSNDCNAISNYQDALQPFNENGKYTIKYLNAKKDYNLSFDFRTVVGNGTFTYFLFDLNHTISKLGKICTDSIAIPKLNAYEDVPIFCSRNGVNFTTAQDLIFWNDALLVVFTDGTASVICRFTKPLENFEISRIERLKCPYQPRQNTYFHKQNTGVCYDKTVKKCRSSSNNVSIVLELLLECKFMLRWKGKGLYQKQLLTRLMLQALI